MTLTSRSSSCAGLDRMVGLCTKLYIFYLQLTLLIQICWNTCFQKRHCPNVRSHAPAHDYEGASWYVSLSFKLHEEVDYSSEPPLRDGSRCLFCVIRLVSAMLTETMTTCSKWTWNRWWLIGKYQREPGKDDHVTHYTDFARLCFAPPAIFNRFRTAKYGLKLSQACDLVDGIQKMQSSYLECM